MTPAERLSWLALLSLGACLAALAAAGICPALEGWPLMAVGLGWVPGVGVVRGLRERKVMNRA